MIRRRRRLGGLLLAVAVALPLAQPVRADERSEEEARLAAIGDDAMFGTVGGTAGFYLKAVGGPVVLADDHTYVHDPASAIKVLGHLHAMREVAAGRDNLDVNVSAFRYPSSSRGASDPEPLQPGPVSAGLIGGVGVVVESVCPSPADETPANREQWPLSLVLSQMMNVSDNRMTRAVVLRYGLDPLNRLAAELGMTRTRWDQDLVGCGYQGGKRNALTAEDIGKLYEAVAAGRALPPAHRRRFWDLMFRQPVRRGDHLVTIIQEEARRLGKPQGIEPLVDGLVRRWKGGAYDLCSPACLTPTFIREMDGLASIPHKVSGRIVMRDFVFSSFIADATAVCTGFPCAAATRLEAAMFRTADELLRLPIREALRTF